MTGALVKHTRGPFQNPKFRSRYLRAGRGTTPRVYVGGVVKVVNRIEGG
jgi:hypothetical protein